MSDYALQRLNMVESQVRPSDLTDRRIARAMLSLPREAFVPKGQRNVCYMDRDLVLERVDSDGDMARVVLAPRTQARLIQLLQVPDDAIVLDLACGLGYSTAILSELAGTVLGVEPDPSRVEMANAALAEVGADNARVTSAPLIDGQSDEAPFDCILVNGAVQTMPESLLDQLKDGGRLAAVIMDGQVGRATEWRRHGNTFASRPVFDATTAVLPGFERPAAFVF